MRIKILPIDKVFSKLVRVRAGGKCEYCGKEAETQVSHFIGRRYRATRWDTANCAALCFSCHTFLTENPYWHNEFFKKRLGSERFEQLVVKAQLPGPRPKEVKAMLARLKEMLAAEEAG